MAEEPIPNCRLPFLVRIYFFAQKPIVLAKMLIQGHLGLDLQIYKNQTIQDRFFLCLWWLLDIILLAFTRHTRQETESYAQKPLIIALFQHKMLIIGP